MTEGPTEFEAKERALRELSMTESEFFAAGDNSGLGLEPNDSTLRDYLVFDHGVIAPVL